MQPVSHHAQRWPRRRANDRSRERAHPGGVAACQLVILAFPQPLATLARALTLAAGGRMKSALELDFLNSYTRLTRLYARTFGVTHKTFV